MIVKHNLEQYEHGVNSDLVPNSPRGHRHLDQKVLLSTVFAIW